MNKVIEDLKRSVTRQAVYFLEEAGEFYPFGSIIDSENTLSPIGVYMENEHPNSKDVLNELEKGVIQGIKQKKYKAAAIGCDVFIKSDKEHKISAIEIRILTDNNVAINYYVPYIFNEKNKVELKNSYEEKGTLSLS